MADASWQRVARSEELQGEGPYALSVNDVELVVIRTPGGLRAYEGRCPHRGALLGEGELHDGVLVCRNHRWRFDVGNGQRDGGTECLARCDVREVDGHVLVDVSSLIRGRASSARRRIEDLPGPPRLPLVGSTHLIEPEQFHLQLEGWSKKYGTPYRLALGPRTAIVLAEMADSMPVLRERPQTFRRLSVLAPIFEELGVNGLFSAEGPAWRVQRRLTMEALSHRHLRSFYPTLVTVAERLRNRWRKAAERGDVLDLVEEWKRFTVDVTTFLAFGYDIDTISTDGDVIQEKLGHVLPAISRRILAPLPFWRWIRLPRDRAVDRALAELQSWLAGLVTEARARLESDPARAATPTNFLEAMLVARDADGKPFDGETIFANAMTMLIAGEDTTAFTLAWCVHHLLDSPADVDRFRTELGRVLGEAHVPEQLETASRLEYADAIANESMRLRPVAPFIFLESITDTVVAGIEVPNGTVVIPLLRPPAVRAESFGDPEVFRPMRWLDEQARAGAHEPGAMQPFGSGPRICPGRTLALVEMRLALATLYQNFEVERVGDGRSVGEQFNFTVCPSELKVRLRQRVAPER